MPVPTLSPREVTLPARSASPPELLAVTGLIAEEESAVSDAPAHCPEALGAVLLLLSPREPRPPKRPER
ncbi:hypothetical protein CFP65_4620 [Kitasatospora sp. MMS16-BH015]|uniref:hypothetical protein n=1 Tax=Kitasatospora sp. MMS16-BH015 TaxID=2018025 RepID=UPI000CA34FC5|nr:hypothetical protein [Kitasatospora sp. MMS16-BH015]AUG79355.1 hypothetical protein CFP65_4620 [Kitasatospora sp. MMS16-BH015]